MFNGNSRELESQALKLSMKAQLDEFYSKKENLEKEIRNKESDLKVISNLISILENDLNSEKIQTNETSLFPEEPQIKSNREIVIDLFKQHKNNGLTAAELFNLLNEKLSKTAVKYFIGALLKDRIIKQKDPKQKRDRKYIPA